MRKLITLTLLTCTVTLSAWADRTVKATDSAISYTGRVLKTNDGNVRYDWVGTYFQTDFTGGRIAINVEVHRRRVWLHHHSLGYRSFKRNAEGCTRTRKAD